MIARISIDCYGLFIDNLCIYQVDRSDLEFPQRRLKSVHTRGNARRINGVTREIYGKHTGNIG